MRKTVKVYDCPIAKYYLNTKSRDIKTNCIDKGKYNYRGSN